MYGSETFDKTKRSPGDVRLSRGLLFVPRGDLLVHLVISGGIRRPGFAQLATNDQLGFAGSSFGVGRGLILENCYDACHDTSSTAI